MRSCPTPISSSPTLIRRGGFAYDTAEAFAAVRNNFALGAAPDLVVVTGDVTDHGRAAQYRVAAKALSSLGTPVNVCPGNHDQAAAFTTAMAHPFLGTSRAIEIDNWCFLFVDSNSGVMRSDPAGHLIDPDYLDRLHGNGSLGERETSWIREMHAATEAEHVFIWLHHPPGTDGLARDAAYADEWRALVPELSKVRGTGAGHTHIPLSYDFEGWPIFVSPALKNNFDIEAETTLPPGYRSYSFASDGAVTSDVVLVDDARWPRHPLGRAVMALMRGELTWSEFDEIVARKRAELG